MNNIMRRQKPQKRKWRTKTFTGRNYRPYVTAIGQLTLVWNDFHEDLALLFIELLSNGCAYPATDIWSSSIYDRPKRAMLRAVIATDWNDFDSKYPKLVPDLTWLLNEADKLEDSRNDIVHSPLVFFGNDNVFAQQTGQVGRTVPSIAFGNRRALKLAKKDLLTEFRWCRDASIVLRDFAGEIYEAVAACAAWPERPSLPNRGQKKTRQARPPQAHSK
jgi:hypothetical protein